MEVISLTELPITDMAHINTKRSNVILSLENNKIFCSRGDIALGFRINYPEKYSLSDSDFDSIHSDWVRGLHNLIPGTIVVKTDIFQKERFNTSHLPQNDFLQKATANYFQGREYLEHTGYLFFIFSKLNSINSSSIQNPFIFPSIKGINHDKYQLDSFTNAVEESVKLIGNNEQIKLTPLSEQEITSYQQFYFNGFQNNYLTDLEIKKDYIDVDNKIVGIYGLTNEDKFPENVETAIEDSSFSSKQEGFVFYQGFMDAFGLNLNCNHIYNQIIFIDNHKVHLNNIHDRWKNLNGSKGFSPDNKQAAMLLEEYEAEVIKDSSAHYIRGHSNVIFWADSEDEFDFVKKKIVTLFKVNDFTPYLATKGNLKNLFLNSFFTNISCLDSNNTYIVDLKVACSLFINSSNYRNDQEGIIFNSRVDNTPVVYDFWDAFKKYITSKNFNIVAPTGRGKSFTFSHILRQLLADPQNVKGVIMDLGRSYEKYAYLLPKEDVLFFTYKEGEPLGLNPFKLFDQQLTSMKIEELSEFIWILIKKQNRPEEVEKTSMRKIITHYYETVESNHSWESFYRFIELNQEHLYEQLDIENHDFFRIDEFLHAGSDFVGDGIYSYLLKGEDDNSGNFVDKKLIIFELDEIKENELLLTIMLQVISEAIHKTIWQDRKTKGFVYFDEFAKQLKMPNVLSRVEYYFQAIRKQNGAAGIVLQSLNQLPQNSISNTILENTETFIFLQSNDYRSSIERLKLNDHEISQLKSMRSQFDGDIKYSEIFIKRNKRSNVYRIEVPPEVYLAFQTEGEQHTAIMELFEQSGSMETAINTYLNKYPNNGNSN